MPHSDGSNLSTGFLCLIRYLMGITYSTAGVEAGLSTLYIFLCPGAHQMMRARTRALRGSKEDGNDQEMQKVLPSKDQAIPPEYEQETTQ